MHHLGSWRKRCLIRHEKAQNAEKGQKNGQKSTFLAISANEETQKILLTPFPPSYEMKNIFKKRNKLLDRKFRI
jgi:hypothetical protein